MHEHEWVNVEKSRSRSYQDQICWMCGVSRMQAAAALDHPHVKEIQDMLIKLEETRISPPGIMITRDQLSEFQKTGMITVKEIQITADPDQLQKDLHDHLEKMQQSVISSMMVPSNVLGGGS